jgi:hypothetical protein
MHIHEKYSVKSSLPHIFRTHQLPVVHRQHALHVERGLVKKAAVVAVAAVAPLIVDAYPFLLIMYGTMRH